jgi:hypothetical protein
MMQGKQQSDPSDESMHDLDVRTAEVDIEKVMDDRLPGTGPFRTREYVCPSCGRTKRARIPPPCLHCGRRMK